MMCSKRSVLQLLLTLLFGVAFFDSQCLAQDEGDAQKAEMQVLSKYLGTWDVKYEDAKFPDAAAVVSGELVLDGKFVRRTGKLTHARKEYLEMLTFDPMRKCYRRWEFSSTGIPLEYKGTWDDQTATMTWIAEIESGPGGTRVSTNTFTDNATMKWETQSRNAKNESVGQPARGISTMRADAK